MFTWTNIYFVVLCIHQQEIIANSIIWAVSPEIHILKYEKSSIWSNQNNFQIFHKQMFTFWGWELLARNSCHEQKSDYHCLRNKCWETEGLQLFTTAIDISCCSLISNLLHQQIVLESNWRQPSACGVRRFFCIVSRTEILLLVVVLLLVVIVVVDVVVVVVTYRLFSFFWF